MYQSSDRSNSGSCFYSNIANLAVAAPNSTRSTDSEIACLQNLNFNSVVDNWRKSTISQPEIRLPREDMLLVKRFSKPCERPKYIDEPKLVKI
jgi:hypothetical protein